MLPEKIEKALAQLIQEQPFFGMLLAQTPLTETKLFPTFATDGVVIWYNMAYVDKLTAGEVKAVLLHEALHIALLHCSNRRGVGLEKEIWACACDYAVNNEVHRAGYPLRKGSLHNEAFRNHTAENIYSLILNDPKSYLIEIPFDTLLPGNESRIEEVKERIRSAYHFAKEMGRVPDHISEALRSIVKDTTPWQSVLNDFMVDLHTQALDNCRFLPPNRRYISQDIYLPSYQGEGVLLIAVAVDTSGSIESDTLARFAGAIEALSRLVERALVFTADADVHEVVEMSGFKSALDELKFIGRGGTDFRPVFTKVEELGLRPDVLIYLTDGDGVYPGKEPSYPVVWALTSDGSCPPWGKAIQIPEEAQA